MTVRQAEMISLEVEDKLWRDGVIGEQTPEQLRNTVLFLIGVNCGLRAGDEHHNLRRDGIEKPSQFSFHCNDKG